MSCSHGTCNTHSEVTHAGIRIWKCSVCGARAPWAEGWIYKGAYLECKRCGWCPIDEVRCPSCSEGIPAEGDEDDVEVPKKRGRARPARALSEEQQQELDRLNAEIARLTRERNKLRRAKAKGATDG